MNWFYSPDGSERFEVTEEVLLQLIHDGKVTRTALVWRDGMADWAVAGQANPAWFGSSPSGLAPTSALPPPVELPPPVAVAPVPPPAAGVSPWARGATEPPESIPPPSPAAEVVAPSVELAVPPAPPPSEYTPSLSQPAPPPPGYDPMMTMAAQPRDSAAMSSVISGSIGLVGGASGWCCCFGNVIAMVAGVTAVVFGHMAYNKARGHPEAERDKGLATVGLVLGYLALALCLGSLLFGLLFGGLSAALQSFHPR